MSAVAIVSWGFPPPLRVGRHAEPVGRGPGLHARGPERRGRRLQLAIDAHPAGLAGGDPAAGLHLDAKARRALYEQLAAIKQEAPDATGSTVSPTLAGVGADGDE